MYFNKILLKQLFHYDLQIMNWQVLVFKFKVRSLAVLMERETESIWCCLNKIPVNKIVTGLQVAYN